MPQLKPQDIFINPHADNETPQVHTYTDMPEDVSYTKASRANNRGRDKKAFKKDHKPWLDME